MFKNWFGIYRFLYNKSIFLINEGACPVTEYDLRNLIAPEKTNCRYKWANKLPSHLRAGAAFEAYRSYKTCLKLLENGNIKHFKLKFKSRKKSKQTLKNLEKDYIKIINDRKVHIFSRLTKELGVLRLKEPWFYDEGDELLTSEICFDGLNYYLLASLNAENKTNKLKNSILSCDPGLRTFYTCLDTSNGNVHELGKNTHSRYDFEAKKLEAYISKRDLLKPLLKKFYKRNRDKKRLNKLKKKYKLLEKRILRKRTRLENLQTELHVKSINFMTSGEFNEILIPKFNQDNCLKSKSKRNISTEIVNHMSFLSHGRFYEKLNTKALLKGVKITEADERYSTKTCSVCMKTNDKVGVKKEWKCLECGSNNLRDINACINIFYFNKIPTSDTRPY